MWQVKVRLLKLWRPLSLASVVAVGLVAAPPSSSPALGEAPRELCVHNVEPNETLSVRSGPSLSATIIDRFAADACGIRLVGECRGDWCQMGIGNRVGWINTRYVGIYELPSPGEAVAAEPAGASPPRPAAPARPSESVNPAVTSSIAGTRERRAEPEAIVSSPRGPNVRARRHAAARQEHHSRARHRHLAPTRSRAPQWRGRYGHYGRYGYARDRFLERPSACVVRVAHWDTLRIRRGPGVRHREIGGIPPGACRVAKIGGCRGAWCRIAWRGHVGWVHTYYLR